MGWCVGTSTITINLREVIGSTIINHYQQLFLGGQPLATITNNYFGGGQPLSTIIDN